MPRGLGRRIVVVIASLGCAGLLAACGPSADRVRRPLVKADDYAATIAAFTSAAVLPSQESSDPGDPRILWNQPLPVGSPVEAVVIGRQNESVSIVFADEREPRRVTDVRDYTDNLQIRINGSTLYVYRAHILLWTEYRLAVYDLVARRLTTDLLVSPEDMPPRVAL